MKKQATLISFIAILLIVVSFGSEPELGSTQHINTATKQVNTDRLESADNTPEDWLSYGKNYNEDRFSPLNQINKTKIDSLGLARGIDLGTLGGIEATPIVVDGIMYVSEPWSEVYTGGTKRISAHYSKPGLSTGPKWNVWFAKRIEIRMPCWGTLAICAICSDSYLKYLIFSKKSMAIRLKTSWMQPLRLVQRPMILFKVGKVN